MKKEVLSLTLILPFPPSVNRLWKTKKTGGMYRSEEYRIWRTHAEWAVREQAKGSYIKGSYRLEIAATRPDKRRRDIGNLEKAISDILQKAEVIEDDCLCEHLEVYWAKEGPECKIILLSHPTSK